MSKLEQPHLLHPDKVSPVGKALMRVNGRLQKRAEEVQAAAHAWRSGQDSSFPDMHSIVYARERGYSYRQNRPGSSLDDIMGRVQGVVNDITRQQYYGQKGKTIVAVNASPEDRRFQDYSDSFRGSAEVVAFDPDTTHPEAYNQLLRRITQEDSTGLIAMTEAEVGAHMTTDQAFHAGALAIRGNTAAVQGTAIAGANAGVMEAAFYNSCTVLPRFAGHGLRRAKPGPGFMALNRSIISIPALVEASRPWEDGDTPGPFNPRFENGGYDGQLGEQFVKNGLQVQLDWANSVIWSEGLSANQFAAQWGDWNMYGAPNSYIPPMSSVANA